MTRKSVRDLVHDALGESSSAPNKEFESIMRRLRVGTERADKGRQLVNWAFFTASVTACLAVVSFVGPKQGQEVSAPVSLYYVQNQEGYDESLSSLEYLISR